MQNSIQKFRQSAAVFHKLSIFFWKIENFNELQLPEALIISAEIFYTLPTYQCLQNSVRTLVV